MGCPQSLRTSLYFEGAGGQTLGRHGYSKNHRPEGSQARWRLPHLDDYFDQVINFAQTDCRDRSM
jgi:hypothetical protein